MFKTKNERKMPHRRIGDHAVKQAMLMREQDNQLFFLGKKWKNKR
jgi:hypothetical protein